MKSLTVEEIETRGQIKESAEYLDNRCLESAGTYFCYSDKDLENATLIFSHILFDVVFSENRNLKIGKQMELAETVGKAIRQLVLDSTGKDLLEIVKQPNE